MNVRKFCAAIGVVMTVSLLHIKGLEVKVPPVDSLRDSRGHELMLALDVRRVTNRNFFQLELSHVNCHKDCPLSC